MKLIALMRLVPIATILCMSIESWSQAPSPWPVVSPDDSGVDGQALKNLYGEITAEPHHDLKGIVIVRNDHLVSEAYFNGDTADTLHDIRSATKSITAALVGIAIQRHYIHSVNDSIAMYLPVLPNDGKQEITIRDLLNMRSGLDANDEDPSTPGDEDNLDRSTDWLKTAYTIPMKTKPGIHYQYCSLNAFLAGVVVENATKEHLDQFAKETLFGPLGIATFRWRRVPVDRTAGQGNLEITARDAAKVGELFLHGGREKDKQIINKAWALKSMESQLPISSADPYADYYGYMWYTKAEPVDGRFVPVHFASGNGGNKIYVIPSLRMVVAITSSAYSTSYGQRRSQDVLLKILAATH
jgi:CubicO group peptidase (beta-lactamase class C family)